jgi:hypothetical protein
MKPLFSTPLLVPLTVSVSLILLSASTPTISTECSRDLAYRMVNEAIDWIDHSKSIEKQNKSDPCKAPPYLSYLRSHLKLIIIDDDDTDNYTDIRTRTKFRSYYAERLYQQPLIYSFYEKNVFQPSMEIEMLSSRDK